MSAIIINTIICIINSSIDFYLINLLFKALYVTKKKNNYNKIFNFLEVSLLIFANYLSFQYLVLKIILFGIACIFHSKKYTIQPNAKLLFLIFYIILKFPFEQLLFYVLEYLILNTRMTYAFSYLYILRRIIFEILIKYCEYTPLVLLNIYYNKFENHFNLIKIISAVVSISCGITLIFTTDSLFYFPNVGRTFLLIVILYIIALILFIYIDREHQVKVLGMQKINQNIIFEMEKLKGKTETEKEIRTIKHNLNNDYTILDGYLEAGQYKEAQKFMRSRIENFKEVTRETHTGNIAIDSIIEQKLVLMKKYNIEYKEMIHSSYIGNIDDYEIALLIGLAFDNAIEAASKVTGPKTISYTSRNESGHIIIQIDNPTINGIYPTFDKTSKKTDKKNHGLGMRKMKEIVNRYGGEIRYKTNKNEVSLIFLLQTNIKRKAY